MTEWQTLSAWQPREIGGPLSRILVQCRTLTCNGINYAERNGIKSRKQMKEFYRSMSGVDIPSSFKVAVITRACAVLRSRTKSQKRGIRARHPKPLRLACCITSGFFITAKGKLFVGLGHDKFEMIQLNRYVFSKLSEPEAKIRSLTITEGKIAIAYSARAMEPSATRQVFGVDRNEKNLTYGNEGRVERIDLGRVVRFKEVARAVIGSFKRNDARVRRQISRRYWRRATRRTDQVLHESANRVVDDAQRSGAAIALEDITGINRMFRSENGTGRDLRFRMNSWPHRRVYQMICWKSSLKGVSVIRLTKSETRGSSSQHHCGEKLRRPSRSDSRHGRDLWCEKCQVWTDRDVVAAVNLAERGLSRLTSSRPRNDEAKGPAREAVKGAIPRADAGKAILRLAEAPEPTSPCPLSA